MKQTNKSLLGCEMKKMKKYLCVSYFRFIIIGFNLRVFINFYLLLVGVNDKIVFLVEDLFLVFEEASTEEFFETDTLFLSGLGED